ncbi:MULTISPECIES: NUDIX hydrolase [unclassified Roseovarius]|uniref:NUDIX hydrolase n=1 Tax=unclassified Roseovarius TaxID=2614913 RepID=UPI00273EEA98|nr:MULTISPECIES: NUDIX hydrolase [unclassified Roseovarius]
MSESASVSPAETERSRFHGAKLALFIGDDLAVILRDERRDIPWPGHWDLPGGGREGQESPEACALRELREELGLQLAVCDLHYARAYHRDGHVFWFFVARMPAVLVDDVIFGAEGQLWKLMPAAEYLSHTKAVPQFQTRLRDYLDICG